MTAVRGWILGCAGFLFSISAMTIAAQPGADLLHKPAPEFVRPDLQHRQVDLHAYRGKVVLLTFWATWCAPCQLEMPHFVAWQREFGPRGLQIVAISMDDNAQPVQRLVRQRHVNYPVIMGDVKLAEMYGPVMGLPATFLIDQRGIVASHFKGESDLAAMRSQMLRLLSSP